MLDKIVISRAGRPGEIFFSGLALLLVVHFSINCVVLQKWHTYILSYFKKVCDQRQSGRFLIFRTVNVIFEEYSQTAAHLNKVIINQFLTWKNYSTKSISSVEIKKKLRAYISQIVDIIQYSWNRGHLACMGESRNPSLRSGQVGWVMLSVYKTAFAPKVT